MPGLILVVDDQKRQRETLAQVLEQWGHEVRQAEDGQAALAMVKGEPVDLILTDLRMPGLSGVELLEKCRELRPDIAVIVMTAFGTIEGAVEAMRKGALDFLTKPIDLDQLEVVVQRALDMGRLLKENRTLRRRLEETTAGFRLLGGSESMRALLSRAARAAETDATVLIRGESGTGKELLARSLHDLSPRAEGPFVAVNCAALPETLLESELFGHVKGAFTGADRNRPGRVPQAAGGTLFLDEIGDISGAVQVKLLRFLQEREYTPVGSDAVLMADVRVVVATHRDLELMVSKEIFREDLFYRMNVVNLQLPPLRDRRDDIPELVAHFLDRYAKRYQRPARAFSAEAMACLMTHDFRGNVRELENIIEQTVVMATNRIVHTADLPSSLTGEQKSDTGDLPTYDMVQGDLSRWLETLEKKIILETLAVFSGNQSSAARHLGMTESGLRYKLGKWKDEDPAGSQLSAK
ncbi:MAG: sigma-54-dependent Fis family transcriptional regulator [Candidatus Krumholzibacteria bacterium]|nr:sigma-54-dependent Fis family transcriptional regulator [Candidatus Krumholzibacteria bacterium]